MSCYYLAIIACLALAQTQVYSFKKLYLVSADAGPVLSAGSTAVNAPLTFSVLTFW